MRRINVSIIRRKVNVVDVTLHMIPRGVQPTDKTAANAKEKNHFAIWLKFNTVVDGVYGDIDFQFS